MIKWTITPEAIALADAEAESYRHNLTNSITNGAGTTAGVVAEHYFKRLFPTAVRAHAYSHDFDYRGWRIEVKTKRRTVDVQPYYLAHIAKTSTHQWSPNTVYVFYSINTKDSTGQCCGMMMADEFYRRAKFYKVNDDMDGLPARAACWGIRYGDLHEVVDSNFSNDRTSAPIYSHVGDGVVDDKQV